MADSVKIDAVVIGSGPGGYVAGIRLGQLGVKTLVIEKGEAGGVCLNVGCIPSKALIHAAKMVDKIGHAKDIGIKVSGKVEIDWSATQKWKDGVVKKLTGGVKQLLKANGAELMQGTARFKSPRELEVTDAKGKVTKVETKSVIIATGSSPIQIPGFEFDGKRVLDSTSGLDLDKIPKRMVVIGGGYIGLELGTVYAKLGTKVTVVEALPSVLTGMEKDCVQVVARKLKKLGIEVMTKAKAKSWEAKKDKAVVTVELEGGKETTLDTDVVLVTVGRRPNTKDLGLEDIGVKLTDRGFIKVDKQQKTNVASVYAIGDCATGMMLAHKASKEAEVAAEVIAGHKAEMDARVIPAVVFTDPEIASAGMTEEEAKEAGHELKVGKYPFAALGRALAVNDTEGFAKVIGDAKTGEILGIHVVGGAASELISEAALAIEMGAVLYDVGLTVHPHPTMPESIMEAAKAALGEAIHVVNK